MRCDLINVNCLWYTRCLPVALHISQSDKEQFKFITIQFIKCRVHQSLNYIAHRKRNERENTYPHTAHTSLEIAHSINWITSNFAYMRRNATSHKLYYDLTILCSEFSLESGWTLFMLSTELPIRISVSYCRWSNFRCSAHLKRGSSFCKSNQCYRWTLPKNFQKKNSFVLS